MKFVLPIILLEVFIELTQPGGKKLWIEEHHIVSMRQEHLGHCVGETVIVTDAANQYCVLETREQIKQLIQNSGASVIGPFRNEQRK